MWTRGAVMAVLLGLTSLAPAVPALAQDQMAPSMSILTIDQERLFNESRFGKAVSAAFRKQSEDHIAENRQIEAELETEERDLTLLRAKKTTAEFDILAADFDKKVEAIRTAQDGKSKAMTKQFDADRQHFFETAKPVLGQLMAERGAAAIIDKRAVFLGFDAIDLTDAAIARLDQVLGDGTNSPSSPEPVLPAPEVTIPATTP